MLSTKNPSAILKVTVTTTVALLYLMPAHLFDVRQNKEGHIRFIFCMLTCVHPLRICSSLYSIISWFAGSYKHFVECSLNKISIPSPSHESLSGFPHMVFPYQIKAQFPAQILSRPLVQIHTNALFHSEPSFMTIFSQPSILYISMAFHFVSQ